MVFFSKLPASLAEKLLLYFVHTSSYSLEPIVFFESLADNVIELPGLSFVAGFQDHFSSITDPYTLFILHNVCQGICKRRPGRTFSTGSSSATSLYRPTCSLAGYARDLPIYFIKLCLEFCLFGLKTVELFLLSGQFLL